MELQRIHIFRTKVCDKVSASSLDILLEKSNCTATISDNVFSLTSLDILNAMSTSLDIHSMMSTSLDILIVMSTNKATTTRTTAPYTNTINSPKPKIQVVMTPD